MGLALVLTATVASAQIGPGQAPPPMAPRADAPADFTGYWVAIVTEDWRWRMVTPKKGDYASLPLNAEGRKVADAWDPAADEAAGNQCKAYGAAGGMRIPGRLNITWENDTTLKIELDAGTQTRLLRFGAGPASGARTLQGHSVAKWEAADVPPPQRRDTSLKVVTTNLSPGYLRKNGVPYGENTTVTEYFTRTDEPNGDVWLVVTNIVEDPQYLAQPFITSTHFKKQADATGWNPRPCTAR
jgi:hypothetical protein